MTSKNDLLAPRADLSDSERRLREALNRQAGQIMGTIDAALRLRSASGDVQRMRSLARTSLQDALLRAMEALALSQNDLPHDPGKS